MNNFDFIGQPPISDKFNFLVDEIAPNKLFGQTIDINKIEYNLNLLDKNIKIDTEIYASLLTKKSLATVLAIGKYITILLLDKDRTAGVMAFFCFDIKQDINIFRELLLEQYGKEITNEWFAVYEKYKLHYSDKEDLVELFSLS